ncbi:MAG: tetratricopeptide repeat protein [Candidatus Promineifilaceae bacterium]
MTSKLTRLCDGILQAGWLAALIAVPLFFNIHSDRVFEPDKVAILRSIAVLLAAAALIRFVDERGWHNWSGLRWNSENSIWRKPFILPIALLVGVYLLSTAFSITPRISLLGSYQRLQGTYTMLAYVVFFMAAISTLRDRSAVSRIPTTAIVVSIPVGLYGLLQHYGLDPLPWGGDVQTRIAGHLGNAIFISAYLIMIVPLTLGRVIDAFTNILNDEEVHIADLVRSGVYSFALALQILAIYWSGSRGPLLGLAVGLFSFFLVLLVSLRNAAPGEQRFGIRDVLLSLTVLAPPLLALLLSGAVGRIASSGVSFALLVAGLLVSMTLVVLLIVLRRGWRWLWLSWLLLAVLVAGWLALFNLNAETLTTWSRIPAAGSVFSEQLAWKELPNVGSYGRLFDPTQTTGREKSNRVRVLIWQGVIDLISPHEPLVYPDLETDRMNFWRPLIGYGPESMYVAYNRFYPPELATVEARNASPDRSHNETFDALVITGLAGLVAWQLLYLSVFYYGFRYLGVVVTRRDRNILIFAWIGGGLMGGILAITLASPVYLGVAMPMGTILGLVFYLFYYALVARPSSRGDLESNHSAYRFRADHLLVNAILAATLAHYVEIHLGIAIAATRLQFFLFVAIIFVVAYKLPELAEQPARPEKKRRQEGFAQNEVVTARNPFWAWVFLIALLIGTIGFGFVNYVLPPDTTIRSAADLPVGAIFYQSLLVNTLRGFAPAPYVFLLVMVSWALACLILLSETIRQEKLRLQPGSLVVFTLAPLAIGFFYIYLQAALLREALLYLVYFQGIEPVSIWFRLFFRPREAVPDITTARVLEAMQAMRFLTGYYVFLFAMLGLSGAAFARQQWSAARSRGRSAAYATAVIVTLLSIVLILRTNVRPVQADMVFKRGQPFDQQALQTQAIPQWEVAIAIYEKALEIAPWEDYYFLFLGRAYLERAALTENAADRMTLLRDAQERLIEARDLNPLNTDHSANLARLETRWSVTEGVTDSAERLDMAEAYYRDALTLSPQNSVVRNELARLYFDLRRDCDAAIATLDESLAIDPYYADTYFISSDVLSSCAAAQADTAAAQELYQQAAVVLERGLQLQPQNIAAWVQAAQIYQVLGMTDEALLAVDRVREVDTGGRYPAWSLDFLAAQIYQAAGEIETARALAEQAQQAAPDSVAGQIQTFLDELGQ